MYESALTFNQFVDIDHNSIKGFVEYLTLYRYKYFVYDIDRFYYNIKLINKSHVLIMKKIVHCKKAIS